MEGERKCENFPRITLPSQQQYWFRKHYYNFEENVKRSYKGFCRLKSYTNLQQSHLVYPNTIFFSCIFKIFYRIYLRKIFTL